MFIRDNYRPGQDRLAYAAVDVTATEVVTRVYGPSHRAGNRSTQTLELFKLEKGVFALDFDFKQLGNYIFVVEEDGEVQTILNAKVNP